MQVATSDEQSFEYEGKLDSTVRANILDILYSYKENEFYTLSELRKHCGVALELLDNAQRYAVNDRYVKFTWNASKDGIEIKMFNMASKKDAERMIQQVNKLNSMDKTALKAGILEQLKNGSFNEAGGAGLGLMQLVSRAGHKLEAKITKLEDHLYLCESSFKTPRY